MHGDRDIIIIAEGGCMQGVFGAGVMTAFQESNLLNERVHSIYGSSAGAHNGRLFPVRAGKAWLERVLRGNDKGLHKAAQYS